MQLFNGRQVNRRSADEYRGQPSPQAVQTLTINCTECAAITFRIIVKPTLSLLFFYSHVRRQYHTHVRLDQSPSGCPIPAQSGVHVML